MKPLCFLLLFLSLPTLLFSQQKNSAPVKAPLSAATAAAIQTPEPKTPEEFFARARQLSDLEASGIPFHLKATYVASGHTEFIGHGTFEEWFQSKDVWREEVKLGSYRWVAVKNGKKSAASATSEYIPLRVRQIQYLQILHLALLKETHSEWKISPQPVGATPIGTVAAELPCDPRTKKILCIQQYEFGADGGLRSYRDNDVTEMYGDFQPFGKLLFPRRIVVTLRAKPIDTATIVTLEALVRNNRKLFDVTEIPNLGTVPPGLIGVSPAQRVKSPKLIYSAQLKDQKHERKLHPLNVVVVECTIGTNGEVREPFVQRSAGRKFDEPALEAVQSATFKPGKEKGRPVLVEEMLVILFQSPP